MATTNPNILSRMMLSIGNALGLSPTQTTQGAQRSLGKESISAGEVVTEESAMKVGTVFKCLTTWSTIFGSLPIDIQVKNEKGEWIDDSTLPTLQQHPLTRMFKVGPNSYQTPNEFLEQLAYFAQFNGNNFAEKLFDGNKLVGLRNLHPSRCVVYWDDKETQMILKYSNPKGEVEFFKQNEFWHIKGLGGDAQGLSPFEFAQKSIGVAQALANTDSKLASSGFKQGGVLTVDMDMTDEDKIAMREKFGLAVDGADDRLLILDYGMKLQPNVITPNDAQLDKFKSYSDIEICRFFNVPPALAFAENKLGSNMIELLHAFYRTALKPFISKVEASIFKNLLSQDDQLRYRITFNTEEFLRLAPNDQAQMDAKLTELGALTQNELRERNTPYPRFADPAANTPRQQAQMVSSGGSNIDVNAANAAKTDQKTPM